MPSFSNRLIHETSPYLLQHAHNPVDWYPWGPEALERARAEDKPILVSIGYAACHWCHVMEKESFEDPATAELMNRHFINIKIDREERPDLDHIYMDAVQAMTGSGGWPLNVFLTPGALPFFGGTYFPPQPAYNRNSWKEVLEGVANAFHTRREEMETQARNLTAHLEQSNRFGIKKPEGVVQESSFPADSPYLMFAALLKTADTEKGGFGRAPKFPQTFSIRYLLHYYYHSQDDKALQQALLSLDRMIYGGINDQLGGGFARYATDNDWLIPHFEKMLYDNALLVMALSEAFQLTGKPHYEKTIHATLGFAERDWLSPEGGYYASYDADSEGVEGKYYTWQQAEVETILGADADRFCRYYDITEHGNWEEQNILQVKIPPAAFAAGEGISEGELNRFLEQAKGRLLEVRSKRIPPQLDDKQLLGWNALMVEALCCAYAATSEDQYRERAERTMAFLERCLSDGTQWFHTYKNGEARYPAFLDDLAWLIAACLRLQEVTGNAAYLEKASVLTAQVIEAFSEPETPYFFYTANNQTDVIVRKKEVYDGATPSGNAVMAHNLYTLGMLYDRREWTQRSVEMVAGLRDAVEKYPGSFGVWAQLLQGLVQGIPEIALTGEKINQSLTAFLRNFIPLKVFQSATLNPSSYPLLAGKPVLPEPQFYLCKHYACQKPVNEIDKLLRQLQNV